MRSPRVDEDVPIGVEQVIVTGKPREESCIPRDERCLGSVEYDILRLLKVGLPFGHKRSGRGNELIALTLPHSIGIYDTRTVRLI